jgi:hypothetical protein
VTLHSSMATKMVIQKVVTRLRGRTLKNSPAAPAMPDPKTTHDAVDRRITGDFRRFSCLEILPETSLPISYPLPRSWDH